MKDKQDRKSILGTPEERKALGARTPRKEVSCVECGEKAEAERNGDWRCLASHEIPTHIIAIKDDQPVYNHISVLTCGARGVTLPDGYMATTQGPPIAL